MITGAARALARIDTGDIDVCAEQLILVQGNG